MQLDWMRKYAIGDFLMAGILLLAAFFAPAAGVLDKPMVSSMFLIAFAIYLFIRRPVPIGITSLLIVVLLPVLGLSESLNAAFAGYSNPSNYFIIASFGLAVAIRKTTLPNRILKRLLSVSKGEFKRIIFAYMTMTYMLSAIMSDIAAVMIALAFATELLDSIPNHVEKRRLGRTLMLGLPLASVIGGTATPAGSTVNVMALNILSANTGIEVSFFQWCMLGFPISLAMLLLTWMILTHIHQADNLSLDGLNRFLEKVNNAKPAIKTEKAVLAVIALMVVAWVAGSWIKPLNTTTVAIVGLLLLFFPGINAFTWNEFIAGVQWEVFLMGGAAVSLGTVAQKTGLVELFANWGQANLTGVSASVLIAVLGVTVTLVLLVIPVGPATVSMLTMPVFTMVTALGMNPVMAVITLAIFASNSTILPLSAMMMISYNRGYWKLPELARCGIMVSVLWIALAALWIPVASGWFL